MNNLLWSILTNRVANGEAYAVSKAYVLNMVPLLNQADASTAMDNAQAAITTFAGLPLSSRAASWYQSNAPFQDGLGNQALGFLPSIAGQNTKALETDGVKLQWATPGGGGLTGFAAFGNTPNASGGSVSGSNIVLQPADATHPGGLTTGAQAIGGAKTLNSNLVIDNGTAADKFTFDLTGNAFGGPQILVGAQFRLQIQDGLTTSLTAPGAFNVSIYGSGVNQFALSTTVMDISAHPGYGIKFNSPDGLTQKTLTIDNAGAPVWA